METGSMRLEVVNRLKESVYNFHFSCKRERESKSKRVNSEGEERSIDSTQ
jgi:hypothetical protein